MTKYYVEVMKARLAISADDATYGVQFEKEWLKGKTWEFDPMSDAVGQYVSEPTNKMRVSFNAIKETMIFPEDANRRLEYIMSIENARELYRFLRDKKPNFWFALDMAYHGEQKGFDPEMKTVMDNCVGVAVGTEVSA